LARKPFDGRLTAIDPVCSTSVEVNEEALSSVVNGVTYYFCSTGCEERFNADPSAFRL